MIGETGADGTRVTARNRLATAPPAKKGCRGAEEDNELAQEIANGRERQAWL